MEHSSSLLRSSLKLGITLSLFITFIIGGSLFESAPISTPTPLKELSSVDSDDDDLCVNENMIDRPGQCAFVKEHCKSEGFINFFALRYCQFEGKPFPFWLITTLLLFLLFYILGKTSEQFFCPSLCRIADGLHISPNVAGVTLLAFGNGSPDIFSTIASVQQNELGQAVGSTIGGGVFVTSVVVGVVLLSSKKKINIPIKPFVRDLLFYAGAVIALLAICLTGKIFAWQSAMFIVYYIAYVLVIVIGRYFVEKGKKRIITKMSLDTTTISEKDMAEALSSVISSKSMKEEESFIDHNISTFGQLDEDSSEEEENEEEEEAPKISVYLSKIGVWSGKKKKKKDYGYIQSRDDALLEEDFIPLVPVENEQVIDRQLEVSMQQNSLKGFIQINIQRLATILEVQEKSVFSLILTALDFPRFLIQQLVIPDAVEENYFRPFYIMHPIAIMVFCFSVFEGWQMHAGYLPGPLWAWFLPAAVILSVSIFLTTQNLKPPVYEWIFIFLAMILSVVWIYFIAQELVSLLSSAGTLLNISTTIMGLTILAWGNSVGDLVSNYVVSKNGSPAMALPACYAAPLTNTLLGIGISVTIYVITNRKSYFLLTGHLKSGLFFAFIFLLLVIAIALIVVPKWKFEYKKTFGLTLLLVYLLCTTLSLLTELNVIKFKIWK